MYPKTRAMSAGLKLYAVPACHHISLFADRHGALCRRPISLLSPNLTVTRRRCFLLAGAAGRAVGTADSAEYELFFDKFFLRIAQRLVYRPFIT